MMSFNLGEVRGRLIYCILYQSHWFLNDSGLFANK